MAFNLGPNLSSNINAAQTEIGESYADIGKNTQTYRER